MARAPRSAVLQTLIFLRVTVRNRIIDQRFAWANFRSCQVLNNDETFQARNGWIQKTNFQIVLSKYLGDYADGLERPSIRGWQDSDKDQNRLFLEPRTRNAPTGVQVANAT